MAEAMLKRWKATVLPWPAQSPDLSPIETLWSLVSRKLQGKIFTNPDLLWEAVQREWNAVSPQTLADLYDGIPSRPVEAHGYPTKY